MGWRDWQIPDDWTYKPIWLPPYPIPVGFWGNAFPFYSKKEAIDEANGIEWKDQFKPKYYFFDTPDYADCHKKMFNYGVFGMKLGFH